MNKSEALNRLDALEAEARKLREIINTPESVVGLLAKPVPGSGKAYWSLVNNGQEKLEVGDRSANTTDLEYYKGGNFFGSQQQAEAYARALDTMLLLRHQPGTEPCVDGKTQWIIQPDENIQCLEAIILIGACRKLAVISPCFVTHKAACEAVTAVGRSRIFEMFKTIHHIKD